MTQHFSPTALVVTTIHPSNIAMRSLAQGCSEAGWDFVVAGDLKSPAAFSLEGARFLSLDKQRVSGFQLGALSPTGSYTRKNIGYLEAMRAGAGVIVETDDDNHPRQEFWRAREVRMECRPVARDGWVNAYRYFSGNFIYPRGLPLNHARDEVPMAGALGSYKCPIQQGLADSDPDVDAVYRMLFPLPFHFEMAHDPVLLAGGGWCPFNSQNTTFFREAFPLLYLPAHCSFRMTDIWRSFVAQRVLSEQGGSVMFHAPTVWQERNDHDLHRDFLDETPGYSHNANIRRELTGLFFSANASVRTMMECCYQALIRKEWVGREEEQLLQAWFQDLESIGIL